MVGLYARSELTICVQILQSDGGNAMAAINAASLALIDAGVAMKDYVVACA
jgi:exosome complex component RRP41